MRHHAAHEDRAVFAAGALRDRHHLFNAGHVLGAFARDFEKIFAKRKRRRFARELHFGLHFVGARHAVYDAEDRVAHVVVDLGRLAADFEFHVRMHGRDVAAFTRVKRADRDARVAFAVSRNPLNHHRGGAGRHQGAAALLGIGPGVRGNAVEMHVKLRGRKESRMTEPHFTLTAEGPEVRADQVVDVVHDARRSHGGGPAYALFRGLKENLDRAAEFVLVLHHPTGKRKPHGSVSVMTAGVHEARVFRGEAFLGGKMRRVAGLRHEDAVDVAAPGRDGARTPRFENGDGPRVAFHLREEFFRNTRFPGAFDRRLDLLGTAAHHGLRIDHARAAKRLVTQSAKALENQSGRLEFAPAFFGTAVQRTTRLDHFADDVGHVFSS